MDLRVNKTVYHDEVCPVNNKREKERKRVNKGERLTSETSVSRYFN